MVISPRRDKTPMKGHEENELIRFKDFILIGKKRLSLFLFEVLVVSFFLFACTYPSNEGGGSAAVRHSDVETSATDESMLVRFTAVIMF